jgi:hypothetical protein
VLFARHLRRTAFVAVQVSNLHQIWDCFVGKGTLLAMTIKRAPVRL